MTDLLERLRRDDPAALEDLGHDLLPFVQAAVLAQQFEARDPAAVHQAFREEVAAALGSPDAKAFEAAVLDRIRARAAALPALAADPLQQAALNRLQALQPLSAPEREMVLARFVERLPGELSTARFGVDAAALTAVLARGAALLCPGGDFAAEAALLDPNALPPTAFIELENALTCLSIDVTAFERNPVMAPLPVPKPGFVPVAPPQEAYPSVVKTQGVVDLPAAMGEFVAPVQPAPEEQTTPVGVPLTPEPPPNEVTETQAKPLAPPVPESTEPRAKPIVADEATAPRGAPIVADPDTTAAVARALPTTVGLQPVVDRTLPTAIGLPAVMGPPPLHRKIPGRWYWAASALCTLLGITLYLSVVGSVRQRMQRPWQMVAVVTSAYDLRDGTVLSMDMLATRAVPASYVTPSVVMPGAVEYAVGRKLEFPLQAGDPLLWSHFDAARKSQRYDIVKRGRAFSTVVIERKALGGLLRPGEEVDVLLSVFPLVNHSREPQAVTLLQKVRVLAVGPTTTQTLHHSVIKYNDVTFLLVPEEVEVLSLARRTGQLTVSLRNTDDVDTVERGNTNVDTLLNGVRLKAIEKKRAAAITVIRDFQKK